MFETQHTYQLIIPLNCAAFLPLCQVLLTAGSKKVKISRKPEMNFKVLV